uniref:HSac2 domain-containing protein n=1 Tax=Mola mola TaxID=94237 RepID=A0A3Q3VWC8_MOLML
CSVALRFASGSVRLEQLVNRIRPGRPRPSQSTLDTEAGSGTAVTTSPSSIPCLKDNPLSLAYTHCDCHNGKLESDAGAFLSLQPGSLNQAIKDIEALVDKEVDGSVHSIWLMAEVDHWNNEKERLVLITDNSLLSFKYDFVLFNCEQIQRIPLNFVDRISYGAFSFPKHSLLQRAGEGVRVFWDRLREPTFTSRWNPFATDYPYITFTYHPPRSAALSILSQIEKFREQLKDAAQKIHTMRPVPGKANGVLILNQEIQIEAYMGLMSFLGNQNKLGYCMARGNIGF